MSIGKLLYLWRKSPKEAPQQVRGASWFQAFGVYTEKGLLPLGLTISRQSRSPRSSP